MPPILTWNHMLFNSYPLFMAWIMKTPMAMWRSSKICVPHSSFRTSLRSQSILDFFLFLFMIEPRYGWIPTRLGLLHLGKSCWVNSTISFSQYLMWMNVERRLVLSLRRRMRSFSRVRSISKNYWLDALHIDMRSGDLFNSSTKDWLSPTVAWSSQWIEGHSWVWREI